MSRVYYFYQITNLINGKIYMGVHQTDNLSDGYMGSGKILKQAVKKYGIENFEKGILKFFNSEKEMYQEEAEVITEEFLKRKDVYNVKEGGKGGTRDQGLRLFHSKAGMFSSENREKSKERARSPEALKKLKATHVRIGFQQGAKNSAFGTKWITNGVENKRISKNEIIPEGWAAGASFESSVPRGGARDRVRWITNGTENKRVSKEEEIPEGWRQGATLDIKENRIWITNEIENKHILKTDVIPQGWRAGMKRR